MRALLQLLQIPEPPSLKLMDQALGRLTLRPPIAGHHPSVSGGADCHSKSSQTGVSLKHRELPLKEDPTEQLHRFRPVSEWLKHKVVGCG